MPPDKSVYLTFDDGPYAATQDVLDVMRDVGVKATFFLCAMNLERKGDIQHRLIKRMITEGHSLGNHGYDHDPMTKKGYQSSSTDAVKQDFTGNTERLKELFTRHGDVFPGFGVARLPGDGRTFPSFVQMITREVRLPHASWDFEFADNGRMAHINVANWQGVTGVAATGHGLPRPDDILLLHDLHWKGRREQLAALIRKLQETFKVVPLVPVPRGHRSIRYP